MSTILQETNALRARVEAIGWYHTIDLGDGIITPGLDPTPYRLRQLKLPDSFRGKTVLDIGAWDGFFAFEAERRGASRVMAADSVAWEGGMPGFWRGRRTGEGAGKDGFNLAREHLKSNVIDCDVDVMSVSPETVGRHDIVFFLGVLYHLRHPFLALEKIASVTKEMLVLETLVDMLNVRRPAFAFYPEKELADDPTNWFGPNPAAVVGMLKAVGFSRVEIVCQPAGWPRRMLNGLRMKRNKRTRGFAFWPNVQTDRLAVHAWK